MSKGFIKYLFLVVLLTCLANCVLLDPNYYNWKDNKRAKIDFNPWSGVEKRPKSQTRTYFIGYPMSTMDYRTESRWRSSAFDKKHSSEFADDIGKYLAKNNILQRWGFRRYSDGKGIFEAATPPYEFTFVSIKPTIVVMRHYDESDLKKDPFELKHLKDSGSTLSDYSYRAFRYGTKFKYQKGLLFFSPDLDILPQPLNLDKNASQTIYWNNLFNSGAIEFSEKDGVVYTNRIDNEDGKDFKKDGLYNPNYNLFLFEDKKSKKH